MLDFGALWQLLGVCRMRVRNPDPAVNSLSGNIWIRRIFQYSDPPLTIRMTNIFCSLPSYVSRRPVYIE